MKTPKELHLFKAKLYTLLAVVVFVGLYLISDKTPAKFSKLEASLFAAGILIVFAVFSFIKYLRTSPADRFYDISNQPPEEQISVCRRVMLIMLIVCPALAYMTYGDITAFESGETQRFKDRKPVIFIYEHFGKSAATSVWIVFGGAITTMCALRIKKAKLMLRQFNEDEDNAHRTDGAESWLNAEKMYHGFPLMLRRPASVDYGSLPPKLMELTHHFERTMPNGMPDPSYNNALGEFDEAVIQYPPSHGLGRVVLVETFGGKRTYYFYCEKTASSKPFQQFLTERFPSIQVGFSEEQDPEKKFIRTYANEHF